jgi:serine/threonine-protein kinase HipA
MYTRDAQSRLDLLRLGKMGSLKVFMEGRLVGTLAATDRGLVAFAYDEAWLAEGFSISPFSLPLEPHVFLPRFQPLEGIFWRVRL